MDIREIRLALGKSQKDFAEYLGITRSYLGMVEIKERLVPLHIHKDLTALWNVWTELKQHPAASEKLNWEISDWKPYCLYTARGLKDTIVTLKVNLAKWEEKRRQVVQRHVVLGQWKPEQATLDDPDKTEEEKDAYAMFLDSAGENREIPPAYSLKAGAKLRMQIYLAEKEVEKWLEWAEE